MPHHPPQRPSVVRGFLNRWIFFNTLIAGCSALAWLVLRSGPRPSRLAYPCQQAAFSAASLAFGAPLVSALLAGRSAVARALSTRTGVALSSAGLVITVVLGLHLSGAIADEAPLLTPPPDVRSQVFHVTDCPQDRQGDRFLGLDSLFDLMGRNGLKIYRSATISRTAGSEGIVASDDVVVIKINYQWMQLGGSNTDVLWGLIHRVVNHPDGFSGEVVVCENAQFASTGNFDRSLNNAEDHEQSPADVVARFRDLGHRVSWFDWTRVRSNVVADFDSGDNADGYVVSDYDDQLRGRTSYPKFQTVDGSRVSLKHGVWDGDAREWNRDRLTVINLPVLKSHSAVYGATACVKNYMGLVTDIGTGSHDAIRRGMMGAVMAEIGPPDLNILDCIWVLGRPRLGPSAGYTVSTRLDQLVASTDPVAADMWAVTNILIPAFEANGYSSPWPSPSADPADPSSAFRNYLDRSMSELLEAGYQVTNDLSQIEVFSQGPEAGPRARRPRGRRTSQGS